MASQDKGVHDLQVSDDLPGSSSLPTPKSQNSTGSYAEEDNQPLSNPRYWTSDVSFPDYIEPPRYSAFEMAVVPANEEEALDIYGCKHVETANDADAMYYVGGNSGTLFARFPIDDSTVDQFRKYIKNNMPKQLIRDDYDKVQAVEHLQARHLARLQSKFWWTLPKSQAAMSPLAELDEDGSDPVDLSVAYLISEIGKRFFSANRVFVLHDDVQSHFTHCNNPACDSIHENDASSGKKPAIALEPLVDIQTLTVVPNFNIFKGRILVFRRDTPKYREYGVDTFQFVIADNPLHFCVPCLQFLWDNRVKAWLQLNKHLPGMSINSDVPHVQHRSRSDDDVSMHNDTHDSKGFIAKTSGCEPTVPSGQVTSDQGVSEIIPESKGEEVDSEESLLRLHSLTLSPQPFQQFDGTTDYDRAPQIETASDCEADTSFVSDDTMVDDTLVMLDPTEVEKRFYVSTSTPSTRLHANNNSSSWAALDDSGHSSTALQTSTQPPAQKQRTGISESSALLGAKSSQESAQASAVRRTHDPLLHMNEVSLLQPFDTHHASIPTGPPVQTTYKGTTFPVPPFVDLGPIPAAQPRVPRPYYYTHSGLLRAVILSHADIAATKHQPQNSKSPPSRPSPSSTAQDHDTSSLDGDTAVEDTDTDTDTNNDLNLNINAISEAQTIDALIERIYRNPDIVAVTQPPSTPSKSKSKPASTLPSLLEKNPRTILPPSAIPAPKICMPTCTLQTPQTRVSNGIKNTQTRLVRCASRDCPTSLHHYACLTKSQKLSSNHGKWICDVCKQLQSCGVSSDLDVSRSDSNGNGNGKGKEKDQEKGKDGGGGGVGGYFLDEASKMAFSPQEILAGLEKPSAVVSTSQAERVEVRDDPYGFVETGARRREGFWEFEGRGEEEEYGEEDGGVMYLKDEDEDEDEEGDGNGDVEEY